MVINMKECVLVTKGLVKEKSKGVVNFYKNGKLNTIVLVV